MKAAQIQQMLLKCKSSSQYGGRSCGWLGGKSTVSPWTQVAKSLSTVHCIWREHSTDVEDTAQPAVVVIRGGRWWALSISAGSFITEVGRVAQYSECYGMDGPGIESRWGRDFPHLSRPALGPTQPPVQWVRGLSRG